MSEFRAALWTWMNHIRPRVVHSRTEARRVLAPAESGQRTERWRTVLAETFEQAVEG